MEEAARAIGVSTRTLRRWRERGLVRVVEIQELKRVRSEELDRLLRTHQSPGSRVDAVIEDLAHLLAG